MLYFHKKAVRSQKFHRLSALAVAASLLTGCGAGLASFTGGSIPPGRSVIQGTVVQATGSHTIVPNAVVTIITTPPGSSPLTYRVVTDNTGFFAVNGLPTGSVNSPIAMTVQPPDSSLQEQHFDFMLANQRGTYVLATLPPAGYQLANVAKVTITPQTTTGSTQTYQVQAFDDHGALLSILPSVILDGGTTVIGSNDVLDVSQEDNPAGGTFAISSITAEVDNGEPKKPEQVYNPTNKSMKGDGGSPTSSTNLN